MDASPDLPAQIASFASLQPQESTPRNSPIAGFLLTNADVDRAIGILSLRQSESPVSVFTSAEVRGKLGWLDELMRQHCGIDWRDLPEQFIKLADGIGLRGTELPGSVAFQLKANRNRRLVVALAVRAMIGELVEAVKNADAVLFYGTFWRDEEITPFWEGAPSALQMGHMPVERSLLVVSESHARRKIYLHINNTNPIFAPRSPERRTLEAAGVVVGYDGLKFEL